MKLILKISFVFVVFFFFITCTSLEDVPVDTCADCLTIYAILPFTGGGAATADDIYSGIQMAVDDINAAGGIMNQSVDVIKVDNATNVNNVTSQFEYIQSLGAPVVLGAAYSSLTLAGILQANIYEIPMISSGATSPTIQEVSDAADSNNYFFRTCASDAKQGVAMAEQINDQYDGVDGPIYLNVLYVNNPYGEGFKDVFMEQLSVINEDTNDKFVVLNELPVDEVTSTDTYNAIAETLFDTTLNTDDDGNVVLADAVLAITYQDQTIELLRRQYYDYNITDTLWIGGEIHINAIETLVDNGVADGLLITAPVYENGDNTVEFDADYLAENIYKTQVPIYVSNAYDAAIIAFLAIEEAQSVVGSDIKAHLYSVSDGSGSEDALEINYGVEDIILAKEAIANGQSINYNGVSGIVDFDDDGEVDVSKILIYELDSDGNLTVVNEYIPSVE